MVKKDEDIVRKFAERLRLLRKQRKLTQEELAEKADISYKNIQYLESKQPTCPSLKTLEKIAKGLDISLSKLLKF